MHDFVTSHIISCTPFLFVYPCDIDFSQQNSLHSGSALVILLKMIALGSGIFKDNKVSLVLCQLDFKFMEISGIKKGGKL